MIKPGGHLFLSMIHVPHIEAGKKLPSGQENWESMIKYDDAAKLLKKCIPLAITGARMFVPEEDKWELFPYKSGNYISLFKKKRSYNDFLGNHPTDI